MSVTPHQEEILQQLIYGNSYSSFGVVKNIRQDVSKRMGL